MPRVAASQQFTDAEIERDAGDNPVVPDDVPEAAAPPAPAVPAAPTQTKYTDYSAKIEQFSKMLEITTDRRLYAVEPNMARQLGVEIAELRHAVRLYTEAQFIEPVMRQFGTHRAKQISLRLPPRTMAFIDNFEDRIIGSNYVIRTADPRFIALCLDVIKRRAIIDFHEMQPGLSALFIEGRGFMRWVEPDVLMSAQDIGAARGW